MGKALCVYCRERPAAPAWAPFCGERCQLLDLRNWIDGRYRVPGEDAAPGGETPGADDPDPQP